MDFCGVPILNSFYIVGSRLCFGGCGGGSMAGLLKAALRTELLVIVIGGGRVIEGSSGEV